MCTCVFQKLRIRSRFPLHIDCTFILLAHSDLDTAHLAMSFCSSSGSLEAMGFSKALAERALAATNGDIDASVSWLLEHAGDQQQNQRVEPTRAAAEGRSDAKQLQVSSASALSGSLEAPSALASSSPSAVAPAPASAIDESALSSCPSHISPAPCDAPRPSLSQISQPQLGVVARAPANCLPSLVLKEPKFANTPPPPEILCDLAFTCEIMDDPVIAVRRPGEEGGGRGAGSPLFTARSHFDHPRTDAHAPPPSLRIPPPLSISSPLPSSS